MRRREIDRDVDRQRRVREFLGAEPERKVLEFPSDNEFSVPPASRYEETQQIHADLIGRIDIQFHHTERLVDTRIEVDGEIVVPSRDSDADWITKHMSIHSVPLMLRLHEMLEDRARGGIGRADVKVVTRNRDSEFEHVTPVQVIYYRVRGD